MRRPVTVLGSVSILAILTLVAWQQATTDVRLVEAMAAAGAPTDHHDTPHRSEIEDLPESCAIVGKDATKIVCACNEQQCDDLDDFDWPTGKGEARLVETTRAGRRFKASRLKTVAQGGDVQADLAAPSSSRKPSISVNLDERHQEVLGWGGAFTDAATINIQSLPKPLAERLLESYFGAKGLQYNFGRVPIAGSDFSTRAYSYDDHVQAHQYDLNLTQWALADEDLTYKIPTIKRAAELVKAAATGEQRLKLFASPWSPPKWMKTSNSFRRGHLVDKPEIYQSYANYLVKFYKAYREHGIEFWGATVQNEPIASYLIFYFFNSLEMSSSETIKFVGEYLGPALEEQLGFTKANFKLMIGDDSLGFLNYHVPSVLDDKRVQKYVSGLAFHWYLSGFIMPYNSLTNVVNKIKDKIEFVMMSEACQGAFLSFKHIDLGDWQRAESYASDIIEDFRRQVGVWIDWNLALDTRGGPNWSGNFVDSPIIVDKDKGEFLKQPMYYALAHFSRFMRPGSRVVGSSVNGARGLSVIAAHVKNYVVVNVLNRSDSKRDFMLNIASSVNGNHTLEEISVEPKSVNSIILSL